MNEIIFRLNSKSTFNSTNQLISKTRLDFVRDFQKTAIEVAVLMVPGNHFDQFGPY